MGVLMVIKIINERRRRTNLVISKAVAFEFLVVGHFRFALILDLIFFSILIRRFF